jgi:amino acid transporter
MKTFDELTEKEKLKFIAATNTNHIIEQRFSSNIDVCTWLIQVGTFVIISLLIGIGVFGTGFLITENDVFFRLANSLVDITMIITIVGSVILIIFFAVAYFVKQENEKAFHLIFGIDSITKDMLDMKKEDMKKMKLRWRKVE